jgi:L-cystine uptake protein TcyP (sodium:dicarboxylate symporter family)
MVAGTITSQLMKQTDKAVINNKDKVRLSRH